MIYLVPKCEPPEPAKPQSEAVEEVLAQIPIRRIADQIRRTFGSRDGDAYLNSLLINDRHGARQGFAPAVSHAIFTLITMNELARRRAGENPEIDSISGVDWTNETGRWKIVKSRESKQRPGNTPSPSGVSFSIVK